MKIKITLKSNKLKIYSIIVSTALITSLSYFLIYPMINAWYQRTTFDTVVNLIYDLIKARGGPIMVTSDNNKTITCLIQEG